MNELQEKYIAALRSNGHRQCRNVLFIDGKCCALGLLCEIVFPGKRDLNMEDFYKLTKEIRMPMIVADRVIGMNDANVSFNEIADYLESTPHSFY